MVHLSDYPLIKASEVAPQIYIIILNFLKLFSKCFLTLKKLDMLVRSELENVEIKPSYI